MFCTDHISAENPVATLEIAVTVFGQISVDENGVRVLDHQFASHASARAPAAANILGAEAHESLKKLSLDSYSLTLSLPRVDCLER